MYFSLCLSATGKPLNVYTPNDLNWRHGWMLVTGTHHVKFRLMACSEAHVTLSENPNYESDDILAFDVVLGDSGNTKTVIKDGQNGVVRATADSPDILSCKDYRDFWVRWDDYGLVQVGRGRNDRVDKIVEWRSPTTRQPIGTVSVASGLGSTGAWVFYLRPGK